MGRKCRRSRRRRLGFHRRTSTSWGRSAGAWLERAAASARCHAISQCERGGAGRGQAISVIKHQRAARARARVRTRQPGPQRARAGSGARAEDQTRPDPPPRRGAATPRQGLTTPHRTRIGRPAIAPSFPVVRLALCPAPFPPKTPPRRRRCPAMADKIKMLIRTGAPRDRRPAPPRPQEVRGGAAKRHNEDTRRQIVGLGAGRGSGSFLV